MEQLDTRGRPVGRLGPKERNRLNKAGQRSQQQIIDEAQGWDIIEQTAAQHAAEYGVTYDTSRTMFMRALARAIGAALRDARGA